MEAVTKRREKKNEECLLSPSQTQERNEARDSYYNVEVIEWTRLHGATRTLRHLPVLFPINAGHWKAGGEPHARFSGSSIAF